MEWKCDIRPQVSDFYDDKFILEETPNAYGALEVEGKVVLDIGGCFGSAATYFAAKGAAKVISIEPESENFDQLLHNSKYYPNVILPLKAAIGTGAYAKLYKTAEPNRAMHTTDSSAVTRSDKFELVPCFEFRELLYKFMPTVVKVDCEGAEFDFYGNLLGWGVEQVAMELHMGSQERAEKAVRVVEAFKLAGWRTVIEPEIKTTPRVHGGEDVSMGVWFRH